MSVVWTAIPIPNRRLVLLTEDNQTILTENDFEILVTDGLSWTAETINPVTWATVPIP